MVPGPSNPFAAVVDNGAQPGPVGVTSSTTTVGGSPTAVPAVGDQFGVRDSGGDARYGDDRDRDGHERPGHSDDD